MVGRLPRNTRVATGQKDKGKPPLTLFALKTLFGGKLWGHHEMVAT